MHNVLKIIATAFGLCLVHTGTSAQPLILDGAPNTADEVETPIQIVPSSEPSINATDPITLFATPSDDIDTPQPAPQLLTTLWPSHSATDASTLRFAGERAEHVLSLLVPAGGRADSLVLTLRSSAFVMPENSEIRVFTGDTLIGTFRPTGISAPQEMVLPLDTPSLPPGRHMLRITARHFHRIYCGAAASFDLWSDLDLARSGLRMTGQTPTDVLMKLAGNRATQTPVPIVQQDTNATLSDAQMAAAMLSQLVGGGLQFALADMAQADAPTAVITRDPAQASFVALGADADLRLHFGGNGLPDLASTFDLTSQVPPSQSIALGRSVPLSALGLADQILSEHYWLGAVPFTLPDAWWLASGRRAQLRLKLSNAPGLPAGAQLLVRVNGTPVRVLPLQGTQYSPSLPVLVRFPTNLLNPGQNVLSLQVSIPSETPDQACPSVVPPRVQINADSTLFIPEGPQMSVPSIARALQHLSADAVTHRADLSERPELRDFVISLAGTLGQAKRDLPGALTLNEAGVIDPTSLGQTQIGRESLLRALGPPVPARVAPQSSVTPVTTASVVTSVLNQTAQGLEIVRMSLWPDPNQQLSRWLEGRRGQAVLYSLDPAQPDKVFLTMAEGADPSTVQAQIARAVAAGYILDGHVALLGWDGTWQVWRDPTRLPILSAPLTAWNARSVLGNFVAARPGLYVSVLLGLTLLSCLAGLSYVVHTRRKR